jgi:hypothetical protein
LRHRFTDRSLLTKTRSAAQRMCTRPCLVVSGPVPYCCCSRFRSQRTKDDLARSDLTPVIERLTGEWDFGWQPGQTRVDALVAVAVVAVAGFCVYRLHGIFGAHHTTSTAGAISNEIVPFNPKRVTLEVFGPPGTVATINYLDVNAQPQRVDDTTLPWSYDITTTQPAVFANVMAQGDSDSIGCRIIIDGVVKDERSVNTLNAYTFCLDKSG